MDPSCAYRHMYFELVGVIRTHQKYLQPRQQIDTIDQFGVDLPFSSNPRPAASKPAVSPRRSPRKHFSSLSPAYQFDVDLPFSSSPRPAASKPAVSPRRSPRKQFSSLSPACYGQASAVEASPSPASPPQNSVLNNTSQCGSKLIQPLKNFDVLVDANQLNKAVTTARAKKNPGEELVRKLLTIVFDTKELANSCGQGLKVSSSVSEKGRGPLDVHKLEFVRQYVLSFTKKYNMAEVSSASFTDLVNGKTNYARKLVKKGKI